jgi:hypothetical protein
MEKVSQSLSPDQDHFQTLSSKVSRKQNSPLQRVEGLRDVIFEDLIF